MSDERETLLHIAKVADEKAIDIGNFLQNAKPEYDTGIYHFRLAYICGWLQGLSEGISARFAGDGSAK